MLLIVLIACFTFALTVLASAWMFSAALREVGFGYLMVWQDAMQKPAEPPRSPRRCGFGQDRVVIETPPLEEIPRKVPLEEEEEEATR